MFDDLCLCGVYLCRKFHTLLSSMFLIRLNWSKTDQLDFIKTVGNKPILSYFIMFCGAPKTMHHVYIEAFYSLMSTCHLLFVCVLCDFFADSMYWVFLPFDQMHYNWNVAINIHNTVPCTSFLINIGCKSNNKSDRKKTCALYRTEYVMKCMSRFNFGKIANHF